MAHSPTRDAEATAGSLPELHLEAVQKAVELVHAAAGRLRREGRRVGGTSCCGAWAWCSRPACGATQAAGPFAPGGQVYVLGGLYIEA
ncbi:MAG: hypothetical protein IPJ65_14430 [Archangiaceae bacterium]|nr:hypothetical protein [Archangiaceae bacterium]